MIDPMDRRHQTSLLICVVLVIAFPILSDADKREYGNAYERKIEDDHEFSKKQSKHEGESTVSKLGHE